MNFKTHIATIASLLLLMLSVTSEAQECQQSIVATAPERVFTLHQDGTAFDQRTGLRWSRCALGQHFNGRHCEGKALQLNFRQAQSKIRHFKLGNHNNWRLPTATELSGIVETRCNKPAINEIVFPNTPSMSFWTKTRFVNKLGHHWMIQFQLGGNHVDKDDSLALVRPVMNRLN